MMEEMQCEQSQEIVEDGIPDEQEIVEYKILTNDDINQNQSQTYCTSQNDISTEYKFTYTTNGSQDTMDNQPTQFFVFSTLEEAEQSGQLVATMEELNELTQQESSSTTVSTPTNFINNNIEKSNELITADPSTDIIQFITNDGIQEVTTEINPTKIDLHTGVWTSYDEVIEDVVNRVVVENIGIDDDDDLSEVDTKILVSKLTIKKKHKEDRDPMSLPFSYAGQSFNVQSQKLILNVMDFFKTHKRDEFIDTIKTPQEKAARVLNVSSSVIGKIRKNWKNGKLIQPGKKRKMLKRILDRVDATDEEIIRDIINGLCKKSIVPTIPLILSAARQRIKFIGSRTSFRRILHRMGYKYGKVDKKMVMIDPGGTTLNIQTQPTIPMPLQQSAASTSTHPNFVKVVPYSTKILQPLSPALTLTESTPLDPLHNDQLKEFQLITQQSKINNTNPNQTYNSHDLPSSISDATPLQVQVQPPFPVVQRFNRKHMTINTSVS